MLTEGSLVLICKELNEYERLIARFAALTKYSLTVFDPYELCREYPRFLETPMTSFLYNIKELGVHIKLGVLTMWLTPNEHIFFCEDGDDVWYVIWSKRNCQPKQRRMSGNELFSFMQQQINSF